MIPTPDNLRELMTTMYPDDDSLSEHPMTAVGIVLLAAAILGITDLEGLVEFSGYPRPFHRRNLVQSAR